MKSRLLELADRATRVAECARAAEVADGAAHAMTSLNEAMLAYRKAAVFYLTHPSVADYVRADALKYGPEAREALESIATLIDRLNE